MADQRENVATADWMQAWARLVRRQSEWLPPRREEVDALLAQAPGLIQRMHEALVDITNLTDQFGEQSNHALHLIARAAIEPPRTDRREGDA